MTMFDTPEPENHNEESPQCQLRIWQQNLNKSPIAQQDLLQSMADDYDFAMLQELYINFLGHTRANSKWIPIYPTNHLQNPNATHSIILVSTHISTNMWTPITFKLPDLTGIQLHGEFGTLRILNVYNDCDHNDTLTAVACHFCDLANREYPVAPLHHIILGDFNCHTALWDEKRNAHLFTHERLTLAQPLLNLVSSYNWKMALPKDIPTLKSFVMKNLTQVDNVFCSEGLLGSFISCNTSPECRPPKTDHMPIISVIDIIPLTNDFRPCPDYHNTDWPAFLETLEAKLTAIPRPEELQTEDHFYQVLEHLDGAIQGAIAQHVPMSKPCPYSKHWWSKELAQAKQGKEKLGCTLHNLCLNAEHPVHEKFRIARNEYLRQIKDAKANYWAAWLEELDESSVWTASQLVTGPSSDGG